MDGNQKKTDRPELLWCDLVWVRGTWRIFHWRYPAYGVETHDPEILYCCSIMS